LEWKNEHGRNRFLSALESNTSEQPGYAELDENLPYLIGACLTAEMKLTETVLRLDLRRARDGCGGMNSVDRASISNLKLMFETPLVQRRNYLTF
jgi:hypothetical protein